MTEVMVEQTSELYHDTQLRRMDIIDLATTRRLEDLTPVLRRWNVVLLSIAREMILRSSLACGAA